MSLPEILGMSLYLSNLCLPAMTQRLSRDTWREERIEVGRERWRVVMKEERRD